MSIKEGRARHFSKSEQGQRALDPLSKTTKELYGYYQLTMAKNAAIVVGKPAAIPEGDGGRDMMIQPVYIKWSEKNGRVGLMKLWTNVRIIKDRAFTNPRMDIKLLWPIE